ncbi:MAG TPA: hypothetical protein VMZ29_05760 [Candidatus Bathyarchaeia archaeon]|nr:hypothetical protein [Candidatus Bathyarchaeia archaeon]
MSEEEKEKSLNKTMNEILKWLKFLGFEKALEIFKNNFSEDFEYKLYELSDGNRTTRELAGILPINKDAVTTYWDKWAGLGIMEKISVKGGGTRGKKIFSLLELGIAVPE